MHSREYSKFQQCPPNKGIRRCFKVFTIFFATCHYKIEALSLPPSRTYQLKVFSSDTCTSSMPSWRRNSTNENRICSSEQATTDRQRRNFLTSSVTIAMTTAFRPQPVHAAFNSKKNVNNNSIPPAIVEPQSITVPLKFIGGAYLVYYRVESNLFRAVLDTGSPFLMIPGSCSANTRAKTGCYREQGVPSGLETTFEIFDGFEGEVEWRKAPF